MFEVTLKELRRAGACFEGYNKLVRAIQGKEFTEANEDRDSYIRFAHKEPVSIAFIVESNGIDDALWAAQCLTGCDRDLRLFAVWCARKVQYLMTDERSINALDVAEKFANGTATEAELDAALAAARAAAWAAARDAAWAAAWAAARAAAWAAALAAARDAAWDAARAAAWAAELDAELDAARAAARAAQKEMFIRMCNGTAPWQI